MTRLRKMMLEELQRRNYSAITTRNCLQAERVARPPVWPQSASQHRLYSNATRLRCTARFAKPSSTTKRPSRL
jgi:hypothetical protein